MSNIYHHLLNPLGLAPPPTLLTLLTSVYLRYLTTYDGVISPNDFSFL